jgi:hypothetical protein
VILPYLTSLMKSVSKLFSKFFPWWPNLPSLQKCKQVSILRG